jgi:hypothetical protein
MVKRKQVYKITYPNDKIYVGMDLTGSLLQLGSPSGWRQIAEDLDLDDHRFDLTLRKEVLWESETATDAEVRAMEAKFIRETGANNPAIGYNRAPRDPTPDPRLPFFAYGIFSPAEIAFFQIKSYVRRITDASATGILRIRDGVPVLDARARDEVANGYRIEFNDADAELAYQAIQDMEPSTQYRWHTDAEMNVLVGYKPERGSRRIEIGAGGNADWSSWRDPAFRDALAVVDENLAEQSD